MSSSVLLRVLMHKFRGQNLEDDDDDVVINGQSEERDSSTDRDNNVLLTVEKTSQLATSSMDEDRTGDEYEKSDQHSSEEELEVINTSKRKWSRVTTGNDSSASSDDEVRELTTRRSSSVSLPIEFCTSPPAGARRPERSQSPPAKLCHYAAYDVSANPKKRHRQNHGQNQTTPRPYLDFEKMQQLRTRAVSAWRPSRQVSLIC